MVIKDFIIINWVNWGLYFCFSYNKSTGGPIGGGGHASHPSGFCFQCFRLLFSSVMRLFMFAFSVLLWINPKWEWMELYSIICWMNSMWTDIFQTVCTFFFFLMNFKLYVLFSLVRYDLIFVCLFVFKWNWLKSCTTKKCYFKKAV